MRLPDITKTIEEMTTEELIEHLRKIRHNRETVRPSSKKIAARAETKTSRKKVSKTEKLLEELSPEERDALMRQLELPGEEQ